MPKIKNALFSGRNLQKRWGSAAKSCWLPAAGALNPDPVFVIPLYSYAIL